MSVPADLPEPSPDERAHSERLAGRIRAEIAASGGWIGFARFMQLALYEPGLGYYSAGARKLGAGGDFVTAPEVTPLFGQCLARQCSEVLARLGGGDVLEFGAGSGAMAAAVLEELARLGRLPRRYRILDVSAELRERQRATLAARVPRLLERVEWLDALPDGLTGVVLANEVLDALPFERFAVRADAVHALGVAAPQGRFECSERPAPPDLHSAVQQIESELGRSLPDGYESEVCTGLAPWIASLAGLLRHGVALLIDYGLPRREYYAAERRTGTMLCHYQHRFHDNPFTRIGLQDISAWVDFSSAAAAADAAGLTVAGFTTQAHFLIGSGLTERLSGIEDLDPVQRVGLSRAAMSLTLPGEMGERFKVLALGRGYDAPLSGCAVRDLSHTL
jgi:SAM-dependent MidA family methyltransferase